jgi:uncharacterized protein YraI
MKTMMAAIAMMILPAATVAQVTDVDGWNGANPSARTSHSRPMTN